MKVREKYIIKSCSIEKLFNLPNIFKDYLIEFFYSSSSYIHGYKCLTTFDREFNKKIKDIKNKILNRKIYEIKIVNIYFEYETIKINIDLTSCRLVITYIDFFKERARRHLSKLKDMIELISESNTRIIQE